MNFTISFYHEAYQVSVTTDVTLLDVPFVLNRLASTVQGREGFWADVSVGTFHQRYSFTPAGNIVTGKAFDAANPQ